MIYESYPWKRDLYRLSRRIRRHNAGWRFRFFEDRTYTIIEKCIFYSAFVIRKLIECRSKVSDEVTNYSLQITNVQPLREINHMNRWPEENSHDWANETPATVCGKDICNWLIHSYIFFFSYDEKGRIESFYVSSDYDRNGTLYRIPLITWTTFMNLAATDYVDYIDSKYDIKKKDYVFTRKRRAKDVTP